MPHIAALLATIVLAFAPLATALSQSTPADSASGIMRRVLASLVRDSSRALVADIEQVARVAIRSDAPGGIAISSALHQSATVGRYRQGVAGPAVRIDAETGSPIPAGLTGTLVRNTLRMGRLYTIGAEPVLLQNAVFLSPLAPDALEHYAFALDSAPDGGALRIELHPLGGIAPAFDGWLIVDATTLVPRQLYVRPSPTFALPFIDSLRIVQTWTVADDHAVPDSMSISGSGRVVVAAFGLAEAAVDFTMVTRFSGHTSGAAATALESGVHSRPDAAEKPAAFWQERGLAAAVGAPREAQSDAGAAFSFTALPIADYNRVGALTLGASLRSALGPVALTVAPAYSFGMRRALGDIALDARALVGPVVLTARASVFRQLSPTTTGDRSYPRIMNSLAAAGLHQDYYNYFEKEGWNGGIEVRLGSLRVGGMFEDSEQRSLGNTARWALLTMASKEFAENPAINDGRYRTIQGEFAWDRVDPFLSIVPADEVDVRISLMGLSGEAVDTATEFTLAEALTSVSIPLFAAGYEPVTLTLLGAIGASGGTLPPQYQFRLRTSAATIGEPGGMVSPPKGRYGGTRYQSAGAEINLTDLPWRAAGLPTRRGRGIELILAGAAARYEQATESGYEGTGDNWYGEVGIGIGQIPLFVTDLIAGRVDIRMGLGPLGRFGVNFTLVAPG